MEVNFVPQQPLVVDTFKSCEGLSRIAFLDGNGTPGNWARLRASASKSMSEGSMTRATSTLLAPLVSYVHNWSWEKQCFCPTTVAAICTDSG